MARLLVVLFACLLSLSWATPASAASKMLLKHFVKSDGTEVIIVKMIPEAKESPAGFIPVRQNTTDKSVTVDGNHLSIVAQDAQAHVMVAPYVASTTALWQPKSKTTVTPTAIKKEKQPTKMIIGAVTDGEHHAAAGFLSAGEQLSNLFANMASSTRLYIQELGVPFFLLLTGFVVLGVTAFGYWGEARKRLFLNRVSLVEDILAVDRTKINKSDRIYVAYIYLRHYLLFIPKKICLYLKPVFTSLLPIEVPTITIIPHGGTDSAVVICNERGEITTDTVRKDDQPPTTPVDSLFGDWDFGRLMKKGKMGVSS